MAHTASREHLGLMMMSQHKYERAAATFEQVLQVRKEELGDDHLDTLACMYDLACALHALGTEGKLESWSKSQLQWKIDDGSIKVWVAEQYDRAAELHERVIEGRKAKLGADHADTLAGMCDLAGVLRDQGKLDESAKLFGQVVEGRRRALGGEHLDTLVSMSSLGDVLQRQGKLDEAVKLFEEVVEVRKKLGSDEVGLFNSVSDLEGARKAQGK